MSRKPAIPAAVRQAICADRVAGLSVKEISERHRLHRVTVSRILARFRKAVPNNILDAPEVNYRSRLRAKSVVAIERSLDDTQEVHKAAGTGVQVMRGLGEFETEQRGNTIQIEIRIPPGMALPETVNLPAEAEQRFLPDGGTELPGDDDGQK